MLLPVVEPTILEDGGMWPAVWSVDPSSAASKLPVCGTVALEPTILEDGGIDSDARSPEIVVGNSGSSTCTFSFCIFSFCARLGR